MTDQVSPIVLLPGERRGDAKPPDAIVMKAEAADTNGAFGCFEYTQMPGRGNRLHRHLDCDETKYILEGEAEVRVGERIVLAGAGAFVFIPRGTPHSHRNPGVDPARMLDFFTPGGTEGWFAAYLATEDAESRAAINRQYGIELLE